MKPLGPSWPLPSSLTKVTRFCHLRLLELLKKAQGCCRKTVWKKVKKLAKCAKLSNVLMASQVWLYSTFRPEKEAELVVGGIHLYRMSYGTQEQIGEEVRLASVSQLKYYWEGCFMRRGGLLPGFHTFKVFMSSKSNSRMRLNIPFKFTPFFCLQRQRL